MDVNLMVTLDNLIVPSNRQSINTYHFAAIHKKRYSEQPQQREMAIITNDVKKIGFAKRYSVEHLLQALSTGQNVLLSNFEMQEDKDQLSIRFLSSSAFTVDVDDDDETTEPLAVLQQLKDFCVGLFYTFSHKKKGNRYRLFFQLDKSITNKDELVALTEFMILYLKDLGIPVDGKAKSPTQIIRGGVQGYEVNDLSTTLKVDEWLPKAKELVKERLNLLETKRKQKAKSLQIEMINPVTFNELKKMCETIGHLPTGNRDDTTEKWLQIVYALKDHMNNGFIDEVQAFELFNIISGNESTEKYWNSIKPTGTVTVGTIIFHAKNAGYRRKHSYGYALQPATESIETENISVNKYIPTEIAKNLLLRKQNLLVDSSTGTGKTTAFMNAFKELSSLQNHFFIFATPTIPLTQQVAKDHDVMKVTGGNVNLAAQIRSQVLTGKRIFVTTYDKANELVNILKKCVGNSMEYTIVVDEYHKLTTDYNYRSSAINSLESLRSSAVAYIGLSGTTDDALKDDFDLLVKIISKNDKSPCSDYTVLTYNKEEDADVMLVSAVESILKQTKLLMFINNKDRVIRIADVLRKKGIVVRIVTSDTKKNKTYKDIVELQRVSEEVQVVIATSVIADGVSIKNSLNWSCLVCADKGSPIYNPSVIKQISNRFRNSYRFFCLFLMEPKRREDEYTHPFNVGLAYEYNKRTVESYTNYLNHEYSGSDLTLFTPSKVEYENGIFLNTKGEIWRIEYSALKLRFLALKKKENYYRAYREDLISQVGINLGLKPNQIINMSQKAIDMGVNLENTATEILALKEQEQKSAASRRDNFTKEFNESIYHCYLRGDDQSLAHFVQDVHPDQHSATLWNSQIADYETCKSLGEDVKKRADIKRFFKDIQALVDIASFELNNKKSITKRIFTELQKVTKPMPVQDFKILVEKTLCKQLRVKSEDVKNTLPMFESIRSRSEKERFICLEPLTIEIVANRHHLSIDAIKNSLKNYVAKKTSQQRKVLTEAIQKKWF